MKKLLFITLLLTGCIGGGGGSPGKIVVQPDVVYMGAAGWVISYSPNMPVHPTASGNGWYFTFPSQDGVHYVMVPYHANKPHQTLIITYRISGTATHFTPSDPCSPGENGNFRPMLERQGDALTASQEFYRFWSTPMVLVADGQIHTMNYPLTWDKWTGVFGKSNQSEFNTTMNNLMGVGITFGSCFAGHGVYATGGTAKFELLGFQIQ